MVTFLALMNSTSQGKWKIRINRKVGKSNTERWYKSVSRCDVEGELCNEL